MRLYSYYTIILYNVHNITGYLKLEAILIRLRRNKKKLSGKSCLVFLEIQALTKWFLRDSMSTSLIFNSNQTFFCIVILSVQILKI